MILPEIGTQCSRKLKKGLETKFVPINLALEVRDLKLELNYIYKEVKRISKVFVDILNKDYKDYDITSINLIPNKNVGGFYIFYYEKSIDLNICVQISFNCETKGGVIILSVDSCKKTG